jgi:hypothetical protein
MATVVLFDEFFNHLATGVHNLSTGAFKVALTNTAPVQDTGATLSNITQIAGSGGYTTGGSTIPLAWAETAAGSGIWQLGTDASDVTFTATAGGMGTFRYAVLYNDTPTSPADPLIGYLDYGSAVSLAENASFEINAGSNGWVRLTTPRP